MKKSDIKRMLESGEVMYNDNDTETLEFFKKAVEIDPAFMKKDILSLVEFTKTDECYGDPLGFSFSEEYKEIFKPLNLDLRYDE
jgi:hypothetical protein